MPRHWEPKKDVISCEKPRGGAISIEPRMSEWGNPLEQTSSTHAPIHNAWEGTRGTETSKYPEEEKSNEMPTVAASEEGRAQTEKLRLFGG